MTKGRQWRKGKGADKKGMVKIEGEGVGGRRYKGKQRTDGDEQTIMGNLKDGRDINRMQSVAIVNQLSLSQHTHTHKGKQDVFWLHDSPLRLGLQCNNHITFSRICLSNHAKPRQTTSTEQAKLIKPSQFLMNIP